MVRRAKIISIGLVLVGAHGEDCLEQNPVVGAGDAVVEVLPFQAEIHELTLPPGDGGRYSPFIRIRTPRGFDVVVAGAEDPPLADPEGGVNEAAIAGLSQPRLGGMELVPFGSQGEILPSSSVG